MEKLTAAIVGVTGYTGIELLRILRKHPAVKIGHLVSRSSSHEGLPNSIFKNYELKNTPLEQVAASNDVVFLALPHTSAQQAVAQLYGQTKIIDLSADFRLNDASIYQEYYKIDHSYPEYLEQFVYGLPEYNRSTIKQTHYTANPGCFATVCQLMLLPVKGLIATVDIFALTGSTGSGKTASANTHHPIRNHNVRSYKICNHRHMPEILQTLELNKSQLNFVPTSGPFSRGIFANAFIELVDDTQVDNIAKIFCNYYESHPYVEVMDQVELAHVVGSNFCHISCKVTDNRIVVQGAIDNLVKGAAGNAVQNMNLMFSLAENTGLDLDLFYP